MTPQEAFKIGFLCRCAEEGLTGAQLERRVKLAAAHVKVAAPNPLRWLSSAFGKVWPAAIAGPPLLGLLAGGTLAGARDDTFDADEAKQRELLAEYRRAIEQLSRSRRLRDVA